MNFLFAWLAESFIVFCVLLKNNISIGNCCSSSRKPSASSISASIVVNVTRRSKHSHPRKYRLQFRHRRCIRYNWTQCHSLFHLLFSVWNKLFHNYRCSTHRHSVSHRRQSLCLSRRPRVRQPPHKQHTVTLHLVFAGQIHSTSPRMHM